MTPVVSITLQIMSRLVCSDGHKLTEKGYLVPITASLFHSCFVLSMFLIKFKFSRCFSQHTSTRPKNSR